MTEQFRTTIETPQFPFKIGYKDNIMFLGSCFTNSIGLKLKDLKFNADINPFGILYNPISMKQSLEILTKGKLYTEKDLFEHSEMWHSFNHHSKFSGTNLEYTLKVINDRITKSSNNLKDADFLFITFGTAFAFEHKKTGKIVSNCHKLPSSEFKNYMLNADLITVEYFQLLNVLKNLNPELKIVFTVSPIRHIKDGLIKNRESKSTLFVAIQQIMDHFENTFYFPAYEIMIDDLRDYRFYTADMLHPSETAIKYIMDIFADSFFDDKTKKIKAEVEKINRAVAHRILNPGTKAASDFRKNSYETVLRLEKEYPFLDFGFEKSNFQPAK